MQRRLSVGLLVLLVVVLLTGCGQKGDLYLPDQERASAHVPKAPLRA